MLIIQFNSIVVVVLYNNNNNNNGGLYAAHFLILSFRDDE